MISEDEYKSMKRFYANHLLHSLDDTSNKAEKVGFTKEKLHELLFNES